MYLEAVCNENVLAGWHRTTCITFSKAITTGSGMTEDFYANRQNVQTEAKSACSKLWSHFLEELPELEKQEKAKAFFDAKFKAAEVKAKAKLDEQIKDTKNQL